MTVKKCALVGFLMLVIVPVTFVFLMLQMFGAWLDEAAGRQFHRLIAYGERQRDYIHDRSET